MNKRKGIWYYLLLLFVMMVFSILFEIAIACVMPHLDSNALSVWKLDHLSELNDNYNRVVLGDSRSHQGIDPNALDIDSSYNTFNLAAPGMQTPFFYYTLKRWIEKQGVPKQVLVNISFYLLGGKQWMDDIYFCYYTPTMEEAIDSYVNCLNYKGKDAIYWFVKTRIPSQRYNKRIRGLLNSNYTSFRQELKENDKLHDRELKYVEDYKGYLSRGMKHISIEDVPESNYQTTLHNGYSVYLDYLNRFFELSNQYDFDIYIYDFPWPEQYKESENFSAVWNYYNDMIMNIATDYPRVYKIDNNLFESVEYFVDPLHVNALGATKLSNEIGTQIND